jgi:hypothetical protein
LRLRNALPELLKVLLSTPCSPARNPHTLEEEPDETLGDSIEDETETEAETEAEIHTEKKNELKCPHPECKRKRRCFTQKNKLMRHYHSREFLLSNPIKFMKDLIQG